MNLKPIHHVLTAQMVSSAHQGQLCRSLEFLLEPMQVSETELSEAPKEALELMLASVPSHGTDTGAKQWVRLSDLKLFGGFATSYCVSAITALPLPTWPFYMSGDLDLGAHLDCYFAAYFPGVSVRYSKPNLTLGSMGQQLTIELKGERNTISSKHNDAANSLFSFYHQNLGVASIAIKACTNLSKSPESGFVRSDLSPLQYDGAVLASTLTWERPEFRIVARLYLDPLARMQTEEIVQKMGNVVAATTDLTRVELQDDFIDKVREILCHAVVAVRP